MIKMIRTQIYFPENQMLALRETAFAEDISLSEAVRKYVNLGFTKRKDERKKPDKNAGRAGNFLLSLSCEAKKLKIKGPANLASQVDKYLYG